MQIVTIEDLNKLEDKMATHFQEIRKLILEKPKIKSLTMTVTQVKTEFNCSEYTQRIARNSGQLTYRKMGLKGIEYDRVDVENWRSAKKILGE